MVLKDFPLQKTIDGYANLFKAAILIADNRQNILFFSKGCEDSPNLSRKNTPLYQNGHPVGTLMVATTRQEQLEQISQAVAMALDAVLSSAYANETSSPATMEYESWLIEALAEERRSPEDILAVIRRAELDESMLRTTICIQLDFKINHYFNINLNLGYVSLIENLRTEILERLRNNKYFNTQDIMGYYGSDQLLISKAFHQGANSSRIYLALDKICHELEQALSAFQLLEVRLAYGNLYEGLLSFGKSRTEAMEILALGQQQNPDLHFYSIGSVLPDTICRFLQPQIVSKILLPTLERLTDDEGGFMVDLLHCGEIFTDMCMDYTAAAASAGIHRNTLKLKIERLSNMTGLYPTRSFTDALIIKLMAVYARQNNWPNTMGKDVT
ncbi:MAG: hypothetical protein VB100_07050 [Angelakisella sp.]|nr:hypothetical protein [Angelakisella sp.]